GSPGSHIRSACRGTGRLSGIWTDFRDERRRRVVPGWIRARRVWAALVKGLLMSGEHFIPFRRSDVVAMCADQLPAAERDSFVGFTGMLASLLHYRFHARIEALKEAYPPFNPEGDTRAVAAVTVPQRVAARERVEEELAALARAANFTEIDIAELEQA